MQLAARKDIAASASAPAARLRVAQGGNDNWDVAQPGMGGKHQPPDAFSEIVSGSRSGAGPGKVLAVTFALLLVGAGGYFAFQYFANEKNPVDEAQALYHSAMVLAGVEEETAPGSGVFVSKHPPKPAVAELPKAVKKPALKTIDGNPYWSLPNSIMGKAPEMNRPWTAEEEENWRAGLAHRFTYQRYKTIMDVRERRLKGSEAILWDALTEKKYWTRASAVVGLANFNIQISLQTLEQAIGKERSELTADFFERLAQKPSAGEAFVLRQVVRLLDEKGRLVVLKGIWRTNDDLRDLYIAAATMDPGRHVQRWAHSALASRPIKPNHYNELMAVIRGEASVDDVLKGDARRSAPGLSAKPKQKPLGDGPGDAAKPGAANAQVDGGKAAGKGNNKERGKDTGNDPDEGANAELAEFDQSSGDVEIYDEKAGPVTNDVPDASTFDYKDQ